MTTILMPNLGRSINLPGRLQFSWKFMNFPLKIHSLLKFVVIFTYLYIKVDEEGI